MIYTGGVEPLKRMTTPTRIVLSALLAGRGYGLGIARDCKLGAPTVYVVLARLESHGLAVSSWEDPASREPRSVGPVRRYWELTEAGRDVARKLP
jgi:DNA-binding PadR family transcriptional regulator